MAVLEVPTRTDISVYSFTVELDAVVYTINLTYNTRSERWYFSVLDLDGNPLRQGIKLVSNWPLTSTWIQQGRPDGELYGVNAQNDDDPDRDTLGTTSVFTYDEGNAVSG